ncbi:PDZ domain-containing protein [Saccharopolyspora erythraea]|uniref:PDZ domain-containing protein n=1 Tax=Saccharopolyspora erythraea TaxID=1836 RepID=UPI001BAABDC8|nr:PDZ domain-containing protein [Saccharopolyspora erythraea]QUH02183.1 PDZ domain-containing protein [Saccharopolyspora erythraea]
MASVKRGSNTAESGLKAGDVIVEANGRPVYYKEDLTKAIEGVRPGNPVATTVNRDGRVFTFNVRLDRPA